VVTSSHVSPTAIAPFPIATEPTPTAAFCAVLGIGTAFMLRYFFSPCVASPWTVAVVDAGGVAGTAGGVTAGVLAVGAGTLGGAAPLGGPFGASLLSTTVKPAS
jgi:hypothetical protein